MKIRLQHIPNSIALVIVSMVVASCDDVTQQEFEELCMRSFAIQIHPESHWQEYISRTTNWLSEVSGPIDPIVRPIGGRGFQVFWSLSHACERQKGEMQKCDIRACGFGEETFGLATIYLITNRRAYEPDPNGDLFQPIITYSNMAYSENITRGKLRNCAVQFKDEYTRMAFDRWLAEQ